jgi:hypothetical protein
MSSNRNDMSIQIINSKNNTNTNYERRSEFVHHLKEFHAGRPLSMAMKSLIRVFPLLAISKVIVMEYTLHSFPHDASFQIAQTNPRYLVTLAGVQTTVVPVGTTWP